MPKLAEKTTIYRLIEAGHLARQQMLVPLNARGLEAGDDAILFSIDDEAGVSENQLQNITGLNDIALEMRLVRLSDDGIIKRGPVGSNQKPGVRLTALGQEITQVLQENWRELENALVGELDHKQHKGLRKTLKRFVNLLSL